MAKNKYPTSVSSARLSALSALIEPPVTGHEPIQDLAVSTLRENPFQPRTNHSADSLDDLAQSIKEHGLLSPLLARAESDGTFTVIAGHRRWLAVQKLGLKTVPVVVRKATDAQLQLLALIENIQREDLHVIDKAQAFWRIADQFPTQEKAAEALGVKRDALAQWLRTRDLEAEILTICGTIPNLSLRTLLRLVALPPRQRLTEAKRLAALQSPKPASATTEPPAIPEKPKPMSFQYRDPDPKRKLGIHIEMRPTSRKSAVAVEDYIRALEDVLEKLKQERKREAAKS
ncbi:MAG TPA: ParB/RepB/Spo0J family partition protein [Acidobacteriota bacterium]|nr:ParB/RepB/Spo0J family partition protein [Acidobacteriota bacterium]HNG95948.1 ParB/RepB/Spo0J family partition protein [Acidobacteriota bacterium]